MTTGTTSRSRFGALSRNRDFRMLWFGQASSQLGSSVSMLAVPMLAVAMTGSELISGLVGTVGFIAIWLAQVPAGYIADMFNRRRVMLWCDAARAMLLGLFAIGVVTGFASVWLLLAVHVATLVLWMIFNAAMSQALRQIVPRDQMPEAVSATQVRSHAIELTGPPIGGLLFAVGRAVPFLVDAIAIGVSLLCVRRIQTPLLPQSRPTVRRLLPDLGQGWAMLWQHPFLRAMTLYSAATNLTVSALTYLLIIGYAEDSVMLGASVGVAAGAGLLGSLVSSFIQRRVGLRRLLMSVALIRGGMLVVAAWSGNVFLFVAVLATVMLLGPVVRAALSTAKLLLVPGEVLGRSSSAAAFVGSAVLPLAPLTAGWLLHTFSLMTAEWVVACGFGVVALAAATLPGLDLRLADMRQPETGASVSS